MDKYQLVMQFAATEITDFDSLVSFENQLSIHLRALATVDGHDFGTSEFNIFVLTDNPVRTFEVAEKLRMVELPDCIPTVAYRELLGETYVVLWPPGHRDFRVC